MKNNRILPLTLIVAAVLAGCSSLPANNSLLDEARNDYRNAQSSPQVTSLAAGELSQAGASLDKANLAWTKEESTVKVNHLAYVAKQEVAIALETAKQKAAELAVSNATAERDAVRLEARTREAEYAQRSAQDSQRLSEAAQRDAQHSQRQSEAAQRDAQHSQRQSEAAKRNADASRNEADAQRQAAMTARLNAQEARQQALDARRQTEDAQKDAVELQARLDAMEAKKTDRGMVVTLGDVLFDTDRAQLKSGGVRNIQKLADFFKQYPQRNVMIEGFTDSTGSGGHNLQLSERRADSVRTALLGMGISPDRITWRGYGESYPVASNDTASGRQQNRRVEMVVSDDSGKITPR